MIIEGLRTVFSRTADLEIIGSNTDGPSALKEIQKLMPDLAIIDLYLPRYDGIAILKGLTDEKYKGIGKIVFSGFYNFNDIARVISNGAKGYVIKGCSLDMIADAARTVGRGNYYFDREVGDVITNNFSSRPAPGTKDERAELLSSREREVVDCIADGKSCSETAETLDIKLSSVYTYRNRLMNKLRAKNHADLLRIALKIAGYEKRG